VASREVGMIAIGYVVILGALLVFAIGSVARAIRYARYPIHLRWELYPVPHEDPRRVGHGGSYFEEGSWWTKPIRFNLAGELRAMVPEMLFLKGLRDFNRAMWRRSFPFHFGLYLLIGTAGPVLVAALLGLLAPAVLLGPLGIGLHWLYTFTGFSGVILALYGAAALLLRRLTAKDLRPYTTPGDILNLCWFLAAFGCLLAGFLLRSPDSSGIVHLVQALLTFDTSVRIPGLLALGLVLSALLAAYIPFTHMSHFIGKYFTYHSIRWDDRPLRSGDRVERKMAEYLTYRPTWAAPHVGADGTRSWAEVATTNPAQKGKTK
jgi:nitrate reductase gamma subunit